MTWLITIASAILKLWGWLTHWQAKREGATEQAQKDQAKVLADVKAKNEAQSEADRLNAAELRKLMQRDSPKPKR